jgi:serine/threonine-protein kinase
MAKMKKPARIGVFEPVESIGQGSMGEVWLCHDSSLDRPLVVKLVQMELRNTQSMLDRFQREVQVLASLSHPNIVGVYGYWSEGGMLFLSMEFVNGWTLQQILEKKPILPSWAVLAILHDTLSALAHAHRKKVVHRDLKPSNLMVGFNGRVKLLDFGIAHQHNSDQDITIPGTLIGTTAYMSPEQSRGISAGYTSDLFSLGIVAWEMLTGAHPFRGETSEKTLQRIQHQQLDPALLPQDTPPLLRRLLLQMLQKDSIHRPANAEDALRLCDMAMQGLPYEIAPYLRDMVLDIRKTGTIPTGPLWNRPRPLWKTWGIAAGTSLVVGFLLGKLL